MPKTNKYFSVIVIKTSIVVSLERLCYIRFN